MQAEIARQQEMLQRLESGEIPERGAELRRARPDTNALAEATDPRVAPPAPLMRDLPLAIFETQRIEIPAGRWNNPRTLRVEKRVLDADGDGVPELVRYVDVESRLLLRQEEDRNYDGNIDTWSEYEWGEVTRRVLDSNDDGVRDTWETFQDGRMTRRESDRDNDGVRDAFYDFAEYSLVHERHDVNNDGKIDLEIEYERRRKKLALEDKDHDGRVDTWTTYGVSGGTEFVLRIERDKKGRGFADTFETFELAAGKAQLVRREEDVSGNGEIDIVSIYENGKLVRRQINDPDLLPM